MNGMRSLVERNSLLDGQDAYSTRGIKRRERAKIGQVLVD